MMPCVRPEAPVALGQNAARWTAAYQQRRAEDPSARFAWPRVDGKPVNLAVLPVLLQMTQDHCAYCDGWEMNVTGEATIDHHRPKSRFPELAFDWENLFPACEYCQGRHGKGERWDERALKPDDSDYNFARYFRYVHATGYLEPNPQASDEVQARALATIELLGLNRGNRPQCRKRITKLYGAYPDEGRPYRFAFLPD